MSEVTVLLRTADRTRKAEVTVPRDQTCADLVQCAVGNWALPQDAQYTLVNVTRGRTIQPESLLSADVLGDGDELEVQPVLVAGAEQ